MKAGVLMYKVITFDMYTATLDINGSAIPIVSEILEEDLSTSSEFFKTWRASQWNYLLLNNSMEKGFKSYDYITRSVLDYTEEKFKMTLSKETKEKLMKVWLNFKAWEEASEVLLEIKNRGYKIAMLSNGDHKMLEPLAKACNVEFDYIFSAEDAKKYKPHPLVYNVPFEKLGIEKSQLLHVAGSVFDVMGAKSAGITCAWSNRFSEPIFDKNYEPDYNMTNLKELLNIL